MRFSPRFFKALGAAPVFWLGLAVSLALHLLVMHMVEDKGKDRFVYHAQHARLALEDRVRSYIDVLNGAHALFATTDQLTRAQFHAYMAALRSKRSFPGINNLNFARIVLPHQKRAFEDLVRTDASVNGRGYPDFAVKPAGERAEYEVLTYMEPEDGAPEAFGLDIGSDPVSRSALDLLRDSGQTASSGHQLEVKDGTTHVMLAVRMPLYRRGMPTRTVAERRAAYYGSVGAKLDVHNLMLGAIDDNTLHQLSIRVYDTGNTSEPLATGTDDPKRLLFSSDAALPHPAEADTDQRTGKFVERATLTIAQRVWEVEFSAPKVAMLNRFERYLPWAVLLTGLAASILLFGLSYSLATARRRALEMASEMTRELRASEASLEEAQQMARLGSWTLEPESGEMSWSTETYRILGFHAFPEAPHYDDFMRRIYKKDRQQLRDGLELSMDAGQECRIEHRILQQDGAVCWVQTIARISHDGRNRLLRGTIMDITERKQAVEALQRSQDLLRELTAYQDRIREEERRRIAREIHDELGQTLLALRIDVSMLDARTASSHPRLNEKVRLALHHIDATVKTVRAIINNLRPAALDLGLNAAIEWQVAEFRRRTGIECDLLMNGREFAVDDARATSLFRILQESLTNVIRHAQASQVIVELFQERARLVMKISDNGVGIRPGPHTGNSFGLVGMEERVNALDGEFFLTSAPGKGTTITVHIPLYAADTAKHADAEDHSAEQCM